MNIEEAAEIAYGPDWREKQKEKKIVDALRKARKYIRTVEAHREKIYYTTFSLEPILKEYTEGNEIKAIEDALAELGVNDEI